MSLFNDFESVEDWVKTIFPTAETVRQTVPTTLVAGTFVIGLQSDKRTTETPISYRVEREYVLTYCGADLEDTMTKMDTLSEALYQTPRIPILSSLRQMAVKSFAISSPTLKDNSLYTCSGVLVTEVREVREQETVLKIAHVHTHFN